MSLRGRTQWLQNVLLPQMRPKELIAENVTHSSNPNHSMILLFKKQEAELQRFILTKGCLYCYSLWLLWIFTESYSIHSFHTKDVLLSSFQTMNNKPEFKKKGISIHFTGTILHCNMKSGQQSESSASWVFNKEKYFQEGNLNTMI